MQTVASEVMCHILGCSSSSLENMNMLPASETGFEKNRSLTCPIVRFMGSLLESRFSPGKRLGFTAVKLSLRGPSASDSNLHLSKRVVNFLMEIFWAQTDQTTVASRGFVWARNRLWLVQSSTVFRLPLGMHEVSVTIEKRGGNVTARTRTCEGKPMAIVVSENKQSVDQGVYDVRDLARLLKCSDRHVRRMIDAGEVPGVRRFGRLIRASRAVVDKWLSDSSEN